MKNKKEIIALAEKIKKELETSEQAYLLGIVEGMKLTKILNKLEG